ncbi:Thioredoxin [Branchiostoma belcheri]|nr:Thioredoxin [Branchiostoma belcheri]
MAAYIGSMEGAIQTVREAIKHIFVPYNLSNILLGVSFLVMKTVPPVCTWLFPARDDLGPCELDWREQEILMFLLLAIFAKTRRATSMHQYASTTYLFSKAANFILYMRVDPRFGAIFAILCLVVFLIFPKPAYTGEDTIKFYSPDSLEETLALAKGKRHATYLLMEYYTAWSPDCRSLAPVFADLSNRYNNKNLQFGKLDLGRYPAMGNKYRIDTGGMSKELPTLVLYENGREKMRRPGHDVKGKVVKYSFSENDIVRDFDLRDIYDRSKAKVKETKVEKIVDGVEEVTDTTKDKTE